MSFEQQIISFDPSPENLLFMIKHDPQAFGVKYLLKVASMPTNDPAIDKMLALFLELNEKGFIKIDGAVNKVTMKGHFYLLVKNHALTFWGTILGLIALIWGVIVYFL